MILEDEKYDVRYSRRAQ